MFVDDAGGVFTVEEREMILREAEEADRVRMLYLLWGLKEAYVKAVGTGIVGDLLAVEFRGVERFDVSRGKERWTVMDGLEIWVDRRNVTDSWWVEITAVRGVGEVFYLMVCADREGLDDEVEKSSGWSELNFFKDIVEPYGGNGGEDV